MWRSVWWLGVVGCAGALDGAPPVDGAGLERLRGAVHPTWMGGAFYADASAEMVWVDTPGGRRVLLTDAMEPGAVHMMTWGVNGLESTAQLPADWYGTKAAGDVDGDGLVDALWMLPGMRLGARLGNDTQILDIGAPQGVVTQIFVGDFDGNGAPEILLDVATLHALPGGPQWENELQVWDMFGYLRSLGPVADRVVGVGQLDQDPAFEVLQVSTMIDGLTGAVDPVFVPPGLPFASGVLDVDGDGVSEIFWYDGYMPTTALGDAWHVDGTMAWTSPAPCPIARKSDVDGDGDLDLVCIDPGMGLAQFLAYDTQSGALVGQMTYPDPEGGTSALVVDLDNNGQSELLLHPGVQLSWSGVVSLAVTDRPNECLACSPVLRDVNRDGREDVVWVRNDWSTTIRSRLIVTDLQAERELSQSPELAPADFLLSDDYNADLMPDFFVVGHEGSVASWERWDVNAGGVWTQLSRRSVRTSPVMSTIAAKDGASMAIFVAAGNMNSTVARYSETGARLWSIPSDFQTFVATGDLDGDGALELLLTDTTGLVVLSAATGAELARSAPADRGVVVRTQPPTLVTSQGGRLQALSWSAASGWRSRTLPSGGMVDLHVMSAATAGSMALVGAYSTAVADSNSRLWSVDLRSDRVAWYTDAPVTWIGGAVFDPAAHKLVQATTLGLAVFEP